MYRAEPRSDDEQPTEDVLRRMRIPLIRRAALLWPDREEDVFAIDLALSGIFVERAQAMVVGEALGVRFWLPENELPIEARCRVAWWHGPSASLDTKTLPPGAGLEFTDIAAP